MSISFSSLVRLIGLLAIATTMLAVGVSRLEPPRASRRAMCPAPYRGVHELFVDAKDRKPQWLDVDSGRISSFDVEGGDILDLAGCSPWVDEKGRRQVVGRWTSRTNDGPNSMSMDFGLARHSFPDGEMLDQVSSEVVPSGPPCWFPSTRARVLFEAGDGRLYHFAFEPEPGLKDRAGIATGGDSRPRPLTWRCRMPGEGDVYLSELNWPDDPRMGGRLVVSLRQQERGPDGKRAFRGSRLWWLKLDHSGTEIVEAGPLLDPARGEGDPSAQDERAASVGVLPDGRLAVALLRRPHSRRDVGWELGLTPIHFEGDGRAPAARWSEFRVLAESCQPARPAFSTDGRWLTVVAGPSAAKGRLARLSIDEGRLVELSRGNLAGPGGRDDTPVGARLEP